jgi:hypothetical protein
MLQNKKRRDLRSWWGDRRICCQSVCTGRCESISDCPQPSQVDAVAKAIVSAGGKAESTSLRNAGAGHDNSAALQCWCF